MSNQPIPITERQHQALAFIQSRNPAPTFQEIGDELNLSRGTALNLISRMEAAGHVTRTPGKARSLRVVRTPERPLVHWTREQGLAFARAWRERMKPVFDAIYGQAA
jgi:SOS-response transcriptional repressor LexA